MKRLQTVLIVAALGILCGLVTGLWIRASIDAMMPAPFPLHPPLSIAPFEDITIPHLTPLGPWHHFPAGCRSHPEIKDCRHAPSH